MAASKRLTSRRIGLASSAMSSFSNIWNTKHLSIQTKVRVYQTLVLSILLYVSETWTSLASDMKAIESFHMKCQRRILGIRWHDFVRNSEVSLRTGLAPVFDRITRGRNAIFGHVARLPDNIPAPQAKSSYRSVNPQTLRGNIHQVDHVPNGPTNSAAITTMSPLRLSVEASYWSRSLESDESDATVRADYALTTTTWELL